MTLVSSFTSLWQEISFVMTQPTFTSFATLLTGWILARRRTVTGLLMAAGAVKGSSSRGEVKHHSAYHRVFVVHFPFAEAVARAHKAPDRPLKIVTAETLSGGRTVQAFYSTCPEDSTNDLLTRYARRWSIEEANQASKMHLGFEELQGRTRKAASRTAPTAILLYSVIVIWFARTGHRPYQPPPRPWYQGKSLPSFADMLATPRQNSIREQDSALRRTGRDSRNIVKTLLNAYQRAA